MSVKDAFLAFAAFGQGGKAPTDMDGKLFSKILKDSGLVDKTFTATDIDLLFAKVKDKAARKIEFSHFTAAVAEIAKKKGVDVATIEAKISAASPASSGTVAEANKFHDDKSLYGSGIHANGGPSTVDQTAKGLAGVLDRSPADVRGVKK